MATKSKTSGAISDFINSLASSPVGQEVSNTASNLRQTFQVPVQQIAHAALPKIVPDVTPQQQQQAEQGSEFGMGAIQGQPEADALAPSLDMAAGTVKTAGKAAAQDAKETIQTAKAQPGGLQAGFIKLPPIGEDTGYPYSKAPSTLSKIGKGQNQNVRQIRLPHGYAEDETAANNTLDRLGFQGSGEQQYGQIQPKLTELNNWIQTKSSMATNPKLIKTSNIEDAFNDNLQGSIRRGELTKKSAQTIRDSYLGQLHDNQTPVNFNENPDLTPQQNTQNQLTGQIPDSIDSRKVYQMKVMANQDASAIYKKLDNGGVPTENDKVILAARNAFDNAIAKAHPDVKQATMDMSRIFDAKPSLEKARFNAPPPTDIVGAVLPRAISEYGLPPIVKKGLNKALTSPTGLKVLGGTALVGAGALGGAAINQVINNGKGQQDQGQDSISNQNINQHGDSIPDYYPNVNKDTQGHAVLPTTGQPSNTFMTEAQREQDEAGLTPGTPAYKKIEQKFSQDQEMASKIATPEVSSFMKRAVPVQQNANNILDALKGGSLPMNLINKFDNWNAAEQYLDPKYQTFATQIDGLNGGFGSLYKTVTGQDASKNMLISTKDSQSQAAAKLAYMTNFFAGTYGQYKDAYAATTSPTGNLSSGGQPQAAPVVQPQTSNFSAITGGTLPPIGSVPAYQ